MRLLRRLWQFPNPPTTKPKRKENMRTTTTPEAIKAIIAALAKIHVRLSAARVAIRNITLSAISAARRSELRQRTNDAEEMREALAMMETNVMEAQAA